MTDNNVKLNNKVLEIFWPVIYFPQMHEENFVLRPLAIRKSYNLKK